MRIKDKEKEKRILIATRDLVNDIGFKAASMSKIAKAASVSPATIYLYFPNQESLFIQTYLQAKFVMADGIFKKVDFSEMTVRDATEHIWKNYVSFMQKHTAFYCYFSQFAASHFALQVDCRNIDPRFEQLFSLVDRGIREGLFRDMNWAMFWASLIGPIEKLHREANAYQFKITRPMLKTAFTMAWKSLTL